MMGAAVADAAAEHARAEAQTLAGLAERVARLRTTTDPAEVEAFFVDLVAGTFRSENTRLQSDRDPTKLSMSGLGGCTRACAYSIAGTPASDVHPPEEARQALLGTGAHLWFLPAMARLLPAGTAVEKRVQLRAAGLEIGGSLDLAFDNIVVDLKTVREYRLHGVRRTHDAYDEHYVQVFGYALAEWQAGRPVEWVVFIYMDRTTGQVEIIVEQFTNEAALAVIQRAATIKRFADSDPDAAPRDGRGPGVSLACDRCPWLRRCWGPDAAPGLKGAQVVAAGDYEGLVAALELYANATATASAATADKDFAKLVIAAIKDGTYGRYKLNRGRPGEMDDVEEMKRLLTEAGIAVPKKRRAGQTRVTVVTK